MTQKVFPILATSLDHTPEPLLRAQQEVFLDPPLRTQQEVSPDSPLSQLPRADQEVSRETDLPVPLAPGKKASHCAGEEAPEDLGMSRGGFGEALGSQAPAPCIRA